MAPCLSRRRFSQLALGLSASLGLAPLSGAVRTSHMALATEHGAPDMFGMAPYVGPNWLDVGETFLYANVALQLDTVGVDPLDDFATVEDDAQRDLINAIRGLPSPSPLREFFLMPDWRSLMGFSTTQVEQAIQVSGPLERATVFRGQFDLDEVRTTLSNGGYRTEEIAGIEVLRIRDDGDVAPGDPISRIWLAKANNIAVLDDQTLGFAATASLITRVIDAATGDGPTLADHPEIAALFPAELDELAGAIGVTGGTLVSVGDPSVILDPDFDADDFATAESERAGSTPLPPIRRALFGMTPGGPIEPWSEEPSTPVPGETVAQAQMRALFLNRDAADAAVPVIEERLETGVSARTSAPWVEMLESWEIEAVGDDGLVVLRVGIPGNLVHRIYQFYSARDIGFLSWP